MPGEGHGEDISCGRNWPREAGTQPANCSTRRGQRKKWPTASRRHQLPAGLGSQDCSLGLVPGTASREPRQLGCALPNRWPSPEEEMPEPVGTPVGWTWHSQPLYYSCGLYYSCQVLPLCPHSGETRHSEQSSSPCCPHPYLSVIVKRLNGAWKDGRHHY